MPDMCKFKKDAFIKIKESMEGAHEFVGPDGTGECMPDAIRHMESMGKDTLQIMESLCDLAVDGLIDVENSVVGMSDKKTASYYIDSFRYIKHQCVDLRSKWKTDGWIR